MKQIDIIQKALLSEKAYKLMESGIYTFFVDSRATKNQIVTEIKKVFNVDATKINISKSHPKTKRILKSRKTFKVGGGKKAIVYLKEGQKIELLSPKAESKKTKGKGNKKEEKDLAKSKGVQNAS